MCFNFSFSASSLCPSSAQWYVFLWFLAYVVWCLAQFSLLSCSVLFKKVFFISRRKLRCSIMVHIHAFPDLDSFVSSLNSSLALLLLWPGHLKNSILVQILSLPTMCVLEQLTEASQASFPHRWDEAIQSLRGFGWAINESVLVTHLRKHLSRILNPTPLVCHLLAVFWSWRIWFFVLFPPDIIPVSPSTSLVSKLPFTPKVCSPRTSAVVSFRISLCPYMCQTRCWMPSLSFWSCFYCSQFVFVSSIWLCFWSVANSGMQVGRARS